MACLDTTVLIDVSRRQGKRRSRAIEKVRELVQRGETLATTRLNVAELYVGVARSSDRRREEQAVQNVLSGLEILDFGEPAARLFGEITARLQLAGTPAGDMDVLIAATSLASGHRLITRNPDHFAAIAELAVETY